MTGDTAPLDAPPDASRLARASVAVALGTALSRVTGLGRVGVTAYAIGRFTFADTYNLANSTPNIVYELVLGGVLTATLVPLFVQQLQRRDERATSALMTTAMLALVVLTGLAIVAAPAISWLYTLAAAPEHREAQREVMTFLVRLLLPQMLFYGFTALATALLNARRRFAAAAYAPVLNNLVVIGVLLWFVAATDGPRSEWTSVERLRDETALLLLLGVGTTAGIVAMALALVPALRRAGVRLRPVFEFGHADVRKLLRLSGWTVGYVLTNQLALSVVLVLANRTAGGVAAYQYAFIFFQLPHGLFAVSIMTTVTPELAQSAVDGDFSALRSQFARGLRFLGVVVVPAAVAYVVLAQPIVRLLQRGGFDAADVAVTADTLQLLALGLLAFSVYLYTLRGFYALQDTRTPFLINCFENGVNIVLAVALVVPLGVQGLALAYAGAYTIAAAVALVVLARRIGGLDARRTGVAYLRAGAAAATVALVVAPVAGALDPSTPDRALVALAVAGTVGGLVYLGVLRAAGADELAAVRRILTRGRSPSPPSV